MVGRSMRGGQRREGEHADAAASLAPGKQTLTGDQTAEAPLFDGAAWEPIDQPGGAALPGGLRDRFEGSVGADLSNVRVHGGPEADAKARGANAKAVAEGDQLSFRSGAYDPASRDGQLLIAHEVAHTVQQRGATPVQQAKREVSNPSEPAELEADRAAEAMVSGAPANITRGQAAGKLMAKSDRENLIDSINQAIARMDWKDAAVRLNGLGDEDLAAQVGKLSHGKLAHIREAAVVGMPGWSDRVTGAIDTADAGAKNTAAVYERYEKTLAAAKAKSGSWTDVANLLNGMGDWDIADRLGKLDWFQLMEIKQVANARVAAAVEKADAKRVAASKNAYDTAIRTSDWERAARQLHGFDTDGIESSLQALAAGDNGLSRLTYIRSAAKRIMPDHHQRVTGPIDRILAEKKSESPADENVDYTASIEMPDVSDDRRPLRGLAMEDFAGNAKVREFAQKLAAAYGEKVKDPKKPDVTVEERTKTRFADLAAGFAKSPGQVYDLTRANPVYCNYAKDWMSELREHLDAATTLKPERYNQPKAPSLVGVALEDLAGTSDTGGQQVHPIVNKFVGKLGGGSTKFAVSTYMGHGDEKGTVKWAPFCIDVKPVIERDDRGLYSPKSMLAFVTAIDLAVAGIDGDWSGCYNDATLNAAVNKKFDNRLTYVGKLGTRNYHGALNLHIHLNIVPRGEGAPGSAAAAPKIDPAHEH
jgi:hypothetical protein